MPGPHRAHRHAHVPVDQLPDSLRRLRLRCRRLRPVAASRARERGSDISGAAVRGTYCTVLPQTSQV